MKSADTVIVPFDRSNNTYKIGDIIKIHNTIFDKSNKYHAQSYTLGKIIGFNLMENDDDFNDTADANKVYYRILKTIHSGNVLYNSWRGNLISYFNRNFDYNVVLIPSSSQQLELGVFQENELVWNQL